MKEIIIEIIKILKVPVILLTIYILWPNDFRFKEIISLVDEFKYSQNGDIQIKFARKLVEKLEKNIKELNKDNINKEEIEKIIIDIQALNYYMTLDKDEFAFINSGMGQIKINKGYIKNIFGVNSLEKEKVYKIRQSIQVYQYSKLQNLQNPLLLRIKRNKSVKVVGIKELNDDIFIVLEILKD